MVLSSFYMDLQGFLRPALFFQRECLFLWSEAFCQTVLCPFSHEFTSFFKTRIVFSTRVFAFLVSGILSDGAVLFFI